MFRFLVVSMLLILLPALIPPTSSQVRDDLLSPLGKPIGLSGQSHSTNGQGTQQTPSDDVLRLEANLVTVPTVVMDRNGRYITDLHKQDFQIFEDGVEQEVAFFAPVERPFTILFLLDTGCSMIPYMADLAGAANVFYSQLRPDDQLIVASFNDKFEVLHKATRIETLRKDIKFRLRNAGKTTLIYDAVEDALKHMKNIGGRRAIVLFSDGFGSGIFASAKSNLRDAEEMDVLIYTLQFNTKPAEPPRGASRKVYFKAIEEANNYMRDLAQRTGGRHYQVESLPDLGKTFGLVADELRRQYSLGYYPKKPLKVGERRMIKVKVRLPDFAVRARDSYIVGASQTSQK